MTDGARGVTATTDTKRQGGSFASRAPIHRVTEDVTMLRTLIANVCFIGAPGAASGEWVLVDAGMPGTANHILRAAEDLYGRGSEPRAIVLTHGHFDHVGALDTLLERWDVPVYVHPLEQPYVTGRSAYPPPDPSVGGGMMARLSPLYPRSPIDIGDSVRSLPEDGRVPPLPGWRWLHTPGHTPGHVSFFRDADRALVAGDAVVTVRQEAARDVLRQRMEISRPPAYFTQDWRQVRTSLGRLQELSAEVLVTGHGPPVTGAAITTGIDRLLRDYELEVVPEKGRYVGSPVVADQDGLVRVPPARRGGGNPFAVAAGVAALAGAIYFLRRKQSRSD